MKEKLGKFASPLFGLIIALLTTLITYLIFALAMKNFYLWGSIQILLSFGYLAIGWFSSGLINRNIRRNANNRYADTSFKNPKKAEYKLFIFSCYYAALFGMILNVICFYAFGMGKVELTFLF